MAMKTKIAMIFFMARAGYIKSTNGRWQRSAVGWWRRAVIRAAALVASLAAAAAEPAVPAAPFFEAGFLVLGEQGQEFGFHRVAHDAHVFAKGATCPVVAFMRAFQHGFNGGALGGVAGLDDFDHAIGEAPALAERTKFFHPVVDHRAGRKSTDQDAHHKRSDEQER
jgi:hypothetical protein